MHLAGGLQNRNRKQGVFHAVSRIPYYCNNAGVSTELPLDIVMKFAKVAKRPAYSQLFSFLSSTFITE